MKTNILCFFYNLLSLCFSGCDILKKEQPCCRVALAFILLLFSIRMEVMSMKHFDFKDLMAFGMLILALLTFLYLICHWPYIEKTTPKLWPSDKVAFSITYKVNPPCGRLLLFVCIIYHISINISRMLSYFYALSEYFSISRPSFEER